MERDLIWNDEALRFFWESSPQQQQEQQQQDGEQYGISSWSKNYRTDRFALQLNVRKRLVCGAIAFVWIVQTVYVTTMGILSTDIIKGSCVPWGSYSSFAAEKTITSFIFIIALVLPLSLMVFCYSRIVYKLKHTVMCIPQSLQLSNIYFHSRIPFSRCVNYNSH